MGNNSIKEKMWPSIENTHGDPFSLAITQMMRHLDSGERINGWHLEEWHKLIKKPKESDLFCSIQFSSIYHSLYYVDSMDDTAPLIHPSSHVNR